MKIPVTVGGSYKGFVSFTNYVLKLPSSLMDNVYPHRLPGVNVLNDGGRMTAN